MTIPEWFGPVVGGAVVAHLLSSLRRMGERIGRLERFKDFEQGRQAGARGERRRGRREQ